MIRIIRNLLVNIIWQFLFESINRVDFRRLFNNLNNIFNTMSIRELFRLYRDVIFDRVTNNRNFRIISLESAVNTRLLFDRNNKRLFWLSIIFFIIMYRGFVIFKKLILWPFKLGIYTFIYSLFGIDFSWFFNLFNVFSFNIPQWVFIQYLTLYNNWINWWHTTVNIKNLNSVKLPELKPNSIKETVESENTDSNNKLFNKKNIIIVTLAVVAIVGLGIWYFYFYDSSSGTTGDSTSSSSTSSPNPNNPPIIISDNQTSDPNSVQFNRPTYSEPSGSGASLNQHNVLDQVRENRLGYFNQDRLGGITSNTNLNTPESSDSIVNEGNTNPTNTSNPSSPTGSDGSGDTITQPQWAKNWDIKEVQYKIFKSKRD